MQIQGEKEKDDTTIPDNGGELMTSIKITITLPKTVLDIVDDCRGLVPRSTWIQNILTIYADEIKKQNKLSQQSQIKVIKN